ncbi:MAG: extracellular solute-binding protein [Bacteroidetes bacterium]|nr:extracellular solute-binding protein [Bacteroidota bacterium]
MLKKIYYVDNISKAHQKLIDRFNEIYKEQIQVIPIDIPFEKFSTNERKELLTRFLRSKSERIDVIAVDQIWVPRFAKWTVPLEKYLKDSTKNNLLNYALTSCYHNDTLYASPFYLDISLMFYREDLLKKTKNFNSLMSKLENSITWEDFIKISELDLPYFLFQADDYEGLTCIFIEMLESLSFEFIRNGKIVLNASEPKRALELLVNLVNKYKVSPKEVSSFMENDSYNSFITNNRIFLRGWPGFKKEYKGLLMERGIYEAVKFIPNPHFMGGRRVSIFGGWNLMISKFSQNKNESAIFIEFASSIEAQKILFEEGGFLPINNNLYNNPELINSNPEMKFFSELISKGVHRPYLENYTRISDIVSQNLSKAIKGDITVDEALINSEKKINSEIGLIK